MSGMDDAQSVAASQASTKRTSWADRPSHAHLKKDLLHQWHTKKAETFTGDVGATNSDLDEACYVIFLDHGPEISWTILRSEAERISIALFEQWYKGPRGAAFSIHHVTLGKHTIQSFTSKVRNKMEKMRQGATPSSFVVPDTPEWAQFLKNVPQQHRVASLDDAIRHTAPGSWGDQAVVVYKDSVKEGLPAQVPTVKKPPTKSDHKRPLNAKASSSSSNQGGKQQKMHEFTVPTPKKTQVGDDDNSEEEEEQQHTDSEGGGGGIDDLEEAEDSVKEEDGEIKEIPPPPLVQAQQPPQPKPQLRAICRSPSHSPQLLFGRRLQAQPATDPCHPALQIWQL
jgi:hypothetical protein